MNFSMKNMVMVALLCNTCCVIQAMKRLPANQISTASHKRLKTSSDKDVAKMNGIDKYGNTPLITALASYAHQTVITLVSNGADVNVKNKSGHFALKGAINWSLNLVNDRDSRYNLLCKNESLVRMLGGKSSLQLVQEGILYAQNMISAYISHEEQQKYQQFLIKPLLEIEQEKLQQKRQQQAEMDLAEKLEQAKKKTEQEKLELERFTDIIKQSLNFAGNKETRYKQLRGNMSSVCECAKSVSLEMVQKGIKYAKEVIDKNAQMNKTEREKYDAYVLLPLANIEQEKKVEEKAEREYRAKHWSFKFFVKYHKYPKKLKNR